jgi:hypothetical protein
MAQLLKASPAAHVESAEAGAGLKGNTNGELTV